MKEFVNYVNLEHTTKTLHAIYALLGLLTLMKEQAAAFCAFLAAMENLVIELGAFIVKTAEVSLFALSDRVVNNLSSIRSARTLINLKI